MLRIAEQLNVCSRSSNSILAILFFYYGVMLALKIREL